MATQSVDADNARNLYRFCGMACWQYIDGPAAEPVRMPTWPGSLLQCIGNAYAWSQLIDRLIPVLHCLWHIRTAYWQSSIAYLEAYSVRPQYHSWSVTQSHAYLRSHHSTSPMMQGELHRWYENCEMRTIVLSDDAGSGIVDPFWFPGGHQLERVEGMPSIQPQNC